MSGLPGVPSFLYGTAWKEARTADLVVRALEAGFRGIDTANQRKHYHEVGVAEGIARWLAATGETRDALFLQSKFTHRAGQDHRLPYDAKAPVATQVLQSFESTLDHFHTDHLDSLVLHGPSVREGLAPEDWEAWRAMESIAAAGRVRFLGVSNVSAAQLALVIEHAKVRPTFVQNRCYARRGWDREVRAVCSGHGVVYQGFSLLTANPEVLGNAEVRRIAVRERVEPAQVVFRFALDVGMLPLTGTSSVEHMRQDLASERVRLSPSERALIERIAG